LGINTVISVLAFRSALPLEGSKLCPGLPFCDGTDHVRVGDWLVRLGVLEVRNKSRSSEISGVVIPGALEIGDDPEPATLDLADAFAMEAHRIPAHLAHMGGLWITWFRPTKNRTRRLPQLEHFWRGVRPRRMVIVTDIF
jgi:hypothetical protein